MKRRRSCVAVFALIIISAVAISSSSVAAGAVKYYKIRKGDTLWRIAARNGTSVQAIAKTNGISEDATLKLGKTIAIPTRFTPAQKDKALRAARRSTAKALQHSASKPAPQPKTTSPNPGSTDLVQTALAYRGVGYSRGGTTSRGFDCSGFTRYVYAKYGICLPHSSSAQARVGTPVSRGDLRGGDLVFFHTYRAGISHVGIYVGNGQFVHASTHRGGVRVDSLSHPYYASRYRGARRIK